MNSKQTLYFYKGTCIPVGIVEKGDEIGNFEKQIKKSSLLCIAKETKMGVSREEIIRNTFMMLNSIERFIVDIWKQMGEWNEECMKELCKAVEMEQDNLIIVWSMMINKLIILKALKEDNDNGILITIQKGGQ